MECAQALLPRHIVRRLRGTADPQKKTAGITCSARRAAWGYLHAATSRARAKRLDGPWEDSPYFPLLTARDDAANPLQKSGHACFVEIGGEWYITHICARPLTERGNCTLGRETALQKIEWAGGWPRLANGTHHPELVIPAPKAAGEC